MVERIAWKEAANPRRGHPHSLRNPDRSESIAHVELSPAGARLIESFEGFRARPYHGPHDPQGLWTIGYGTTAGIGPGTPPMTRAQAQARLEHDVDRTYAPLVNALRLPLNQNQFDALVSFVYNVGAAGIAPASRVGRALRAHQWETAADAMLAWDTAGGVRLPGLVTRREKERALFLRPVGKRPAPPPRHHPHDPVHPNPPTPQPIRTELTPAELEAASHNGRVPESLLAPVPGGRLRLDAAAAFNAMNAESERRFGVTLRSEGPLGTYRTVPEQQYLYRLYEEGKGELAAVPGTSNHGLGLAIDLGTERMRGIVDEIGERYGWAKIWSDAPSEWWHLRYRPGVWHPTSEPTPVRRRPDTRTEATAIVQQLLRRHGHPTLPVDGEATPATRDALLAFQRAHGLEPTGGLDRATVAALRGHPAPPATRPDHPEPKEKPVNPDASEQQPILSTPRLPLNRIVALLGPFIAIFAGGVASWLSQNFPGLITDESAARADIIQGTTFVVGVLITWALQHKYLEGWQRWEGGLMDIELAKQSAAQATYSPARVEPRTDGARYEAFDVDPALLDS